MTHIAIIGCGIIGATIAYELSQMADITVTVFDRQPPAQASTGAALGVLMGIISQKTKGRAWAMRQDSVRRYETLIPELEAITGKRLPYNRQGIVLLRFSDEDRSKWDALVELRRSQGWPLELWDRDRLQQQCPQIQHPHLVGAVYSPCDRQIDPTALTFALVEAAQRNGVQFRWDADIEALQEQSTTEQATYPSHLKSCEIIQTKTESIPVDGVILAAGLGSTPLSQTSPQPIELGPVLGQAMQIQVDRPLGDPAFQPVITGDDIHIVPLPTGEYWIGATVEFPTDQAVPIVDADRLQAVLQGAIRFCPDLAKAKIIRTWSGLRPRPQNRSAPVVERLAGYRNVVLATGHYRNGILLAPATAQRVQALLSNEDRP